MKKNKLKRFADIKTFENVFEPTFEEATQKSFSLRGRWAKDFFKNDHPIVLELGCGKGEYTVGLAEKFPDKNFVGVDIKGDRMWVGAKDALFKNLGNAAFLRTWVDYIDSFFDKNEVSEIWLTFPDPQIQKLKKRLSSAKFLMTYHRVLRPEGIVHLKTDSQLLHFFTNDIAKLNNLPVLYSTNDLYNSDFEDDFLSLKTFYERNYLTRGLPITYIRFQLTGNQEIVNPEENAEMHEKEVNERRIPRTNQILKGQQIVDG
jgi:tRNA (guanine-N7-)-methyltransferase